VKADAATLSICGRRLGIAFVDWNRFEWWGLQQ